jgi:hypothetical protein
MKAIAALALAGVLSAAAPVRILAQDDGVTAWEKESKRTFKKQQKQANKAAKKQLKIIRKAQKKQAKAYKKSMKEQKKHELKL